MEFINMKTINSNIDNSLNVNNKLNKNKDSNFIDFINKSNKILKQLKTQDNVSAETKIAISTIEKTLSMNISSCDYKDNGKLDIMGIIRKHGDKLSTRDTKDFRDSLTTLLNQGLIESHDYFEAIKWLSLRSNFKKANNKCEDDLIKSIEEIDKKSEYK
ncbi:hypothetical protein FDB55_04145 [Clostridium botulinum]|uniref:Uncharacterized protein n=3 Tax=Clostridium botulinum TaxID=1491 RepID=A0A0L9Y490_CLOBO|nr:hypothetical protein [Clostridium botulinum]ACD54137.1 hypothetical protein CLH_2552 [Clostridium botulinum E3 str. Alaska E43]AJF30390.1 hypothetical protein ST13_12010 [Clostridium botulinum]AJF33453.1 hypothetical protein ST12_12010 [Clostridium botulinum]KAI3346617.1 hypothetical protein CIT18_14135 [Clostridium botulinum]KOM86632.1 hypothetical protein ACP51_16585 [Clostridium botulinum]